MTLDNSKYRVSTSDLGDVSARQDALTRVGMFGVVWGVHVSYSGTTLTISEGAIMVQGRLIEILDTVTFTVSPNASWKNPKIVGMAVDLTATNTRDATSDELTNNQYSDLAVYELADINGNLLANDTSAILPVAVLGIIGTEGSKESSTVIAGQAFPYETVGNNYGSWTKTGTGLTTDVIFRSGMLILHHHGTHGATADYNIQLQSPWLIANEMGNTPGKLVTPINTYWTDSWVSYEPQSAWRDTQKDSFTETVDILQPIPHHVFAWDVTRYG